MTDTLVDNTEKELDNKYESWDKEALIKKAVNADQHITTIERRLDEIRQDFLTEREQNQTKAKLEDLINQYQSKLASSEQPIAKEVIEKPFNPEQIKSLIAEALPQHISRYEEENKKRTNLETVKEQLTKRFGDNYQNVYKDRLKSVGLSAQQADDLAKTSPEAFLNALGINQQQRETFTAPPASTASFAPTLKKDPKYSDFMKMRKENPKAYYDPKIANLMDKLAQEQGEAFFDVEV